MFSVVSKIRRLLREDLWRIDLDELRGPRAFVVRLLRLVTVSARDLSEEAISLRAMSLVYTTLLSIVPLLAVSFSVLKSFGVHNQVQPALEGFLAPLGPKGQEITETIISFVENLNVRVLGSVGLALLLYTVVSLIQKIESSFNEIWRVRKSRSLSRRFSDYLSVVLVGPVLVFSGLGLTATIMNMEVIQELLSIEVVGTAMVVLQKILPFLAVCASFSFIYIFVPSTRVRFVSALVGGATATVLWQTAGMGFASFIVTSTKYAAIYSTFAILILFMIWIYLSWLILLFGAKVTFYHQYPHFLTVRKEAILLSNRLEEKLAFVIMSLIGASYYFNERRWDLDRLLDRLRLPVEPVQEVLNQLENGGLVIVSCDDPPGYLPARDIETIPLVEVLGAVRSAGGAAGEQAQRHLSLKGVDEVAGRLEKAIDHALGEMTLKDLVLLGRAAQQG